MLKKKRDVHFCMYIDKEVNDEKPAHTITIYYAKGCHPQNTQELL